MADTTTTNLGLTKPGVADAGGVNAWGGKINADLDTIDAIFKSDGTGTGVGLKAAASAVWNAIAGTLKAAAARFLIVDATDNTKVLQFDASSISTGTTRTIKAPDSNGAFLPTGSVLPFVGTTAPAGFVMGQGGTIGDASSGGTARANADTLPLYTLLWNSMSQTNAPVSGGTRGASAAADFAAHKTITLPDISGRTVAGKEATATRLTSGVSGVDGGTLGASGGNQNLHQHTHTVNDPTHTHAASGAGLVGNNLVNGTTRAVGTGDGTNSGFFQNVNVTVSSASTGITNANTGSGSSQNVQPTIVLNYIIAL